jgi:hypothetical protein
MDDYVEKYNVEVIYSKGKPFLTTWYNPITKQINRVDGPAKEYADGSKFWLKDGKLHRLDGYACEYPSGVGCYYIDGFCYNQEDYKKEIAKRNSPPPPPDPCDGKVVEIEGKKYQLKLVE